MGVDLVERGIGLELFENKIALILIDNINEELDLQQELWADRDTEWNQQTGQDPDYVLLELFESQNVYKGHRPSLVESPSEDLYPNLSVMAYQARPVGETIDQATNFSITIDIEVFVKGDSEGETNSRIHRSTEAVHQVLARNDKLDGLSIGWDNDPIIQLTNVFKAKGIQSGTDFFWQGTRLRYSLTRRTRLP